MPFLLSQQQLDQAEATLRTSIIELTQPPVSEPHPCERGNEQYQIRTTLANVAFTKVKASEEAFPNRSNIIDSLTILMSGTTPPNLDTMKKLSKLEVEKYKDQLAHVSFYNALTIITHSLFDKDGIIHDFFLDLLKQYITFSADFLEAIKIKGSYANTILYRTIANALLFRFIDTPLAILGATQDKNRNKIAKAVENLRGQLFGAIGRSCDISVANHVEFAQAYLSMCTDLQTLSPHLNAKNKALLNFPTITAWEQVTVALRDSAAKKACKTEETLKFVYQRLTQNYEKTLPFKEKTQPQKGLSAFFIKPKKSSSASVLQSPQSNPDNPLLRVVSTPSFSRITAV